MSEQPVTIHCPEEAVQYVEKALTNHPAQDADQTAPRAGIAINHLMVPTDVAPPPEEWRLPHVLTPPTQEGDVARDVIGLLEPLRLLNPVRRRFGLGKGPGTLATFFGIPLDPMAGYAPSHTRPLAELLAEPPPEVERCGLFPEMANRIDLIKRLTPDSYKIELPDMQGPFNIAHALLGDEAFTAPYDDEALFGRLMERITTVYLEARKRLIARIGEERRDPGNRMAKIAECSVNLVSADFYKRFVLPHDRRIAAECGPLHIHPCSGPHVFHVTLENLPVAVTEAGHISRTAAGAISVDEALRAIGNQRVEIQVGQELPAGREYEFIREDVDRASADHRLALMGYTGMHWRRKDRPQMRQIHQRIDEYRAQGKG